jgi:hypothetical protein
LIAFQASGVLRDILNDDLMTARSEAVCSAKGSSDNPRSCAFGHVILTTTTTKGIDTCVRIEARTNLLLSAQTK